MADITKTISYLQQEKIIHVRGHRKNHRTGLSIPIYSLRSGHSSIDTTDNSIDRLDMDRFLSCVVSERVVEYRFLVRNLIPSRINMKILDVGSERSAVTNALSKFGNSKNWEVFGIDIVQGLPQPFKDKEISRFVLFNMDARFMGFRNEVFDKIICISTVEHVGIHPGHQIIRKDDPSGDIKAFSEIFRTLTKRGRVVLTVPYVDKDIPGYHKAHRIYNS